ncbi:GspH/FimT family pseudopilin [Gilvimarinus japonicus]|uniref:Type II secretion system protein H n=1 Tax=Gilvimarinus japonicus TaxID=1796469 RepID=A0ABV7HXE2_9GAMM
MQSNLGFTYIESIITLTVMAILTALLAPSFTRLIQNHKVESTTLALLEAVQTTRSYAVKSNRRATLASNPSWEDGWVIFYDDDHDGEIDADETLLVDRPAVAEDVAIHGNRFVDDYISYLGSGASRWASGRKGGSFQAGTITVCPENEGEGYELVLSRGGRLRKHSITETECSEAPGA